MINKISFVPYPTLETDRLILRRLTSRDAPNVYFMRTDPQVNKYIKRPVPTDTNAANNFIIKIKQRLALNESIYWPITLKGKNEMIGSISLWHFSADKRTAEVGYELNPIYHGQGYMSEAFRIVIKYGFETLKLHTITAYTHRENEASIKLLSKHGFGLLTDKLDENNKNNIIFSITRQFAH